MINRTRLDNNARKTKTIIITKDKEKEKNKSAIVHIRYSLCTDVEHLLSLSKSKSISYFDESNKSQLKLGFKKSIKIISK